MSTQSSLQTIRPADVDTFLDSVAINHGPEEILARYFTAIAEAGAARGIAFSYVTFEELVAINEANQDTWYPLTSTFHPDVGGISLDNGLAVVGRDYSGKAVSCQALRRFDWHGTNLRIEAESLRLFYANPEKDRLPTECCFAPLDITEKITDCAAYAGGFWMRPDVRGTENLRIVTSVGRASALAQWGFDHLFSLVSLPNITKNFHKRTGVKNVYQNAVIMRNTPPKPDGDIETSLLWTSPHELVDDLFMLMLELNPEVNIGVRQSHG